MALQDGKPAAIVQALEKGIPGLGSVTRINRGPLILNEDISPDQRTAIYAALRREFGARKRKLLFIAPDLARTGDSLALLALLNYRRRTARPWTSAWLNLKRNSMDLRKALDGKWRNQLSLAERRGLLVRSTQELAPFEWLLDRYEELMAQKNFLGPSLQLLRAFRENGDETSETIVFQALFEDQPVCGVLVAGHGRSATYLVGWNGPEGRKLNANNHLLWNVILELQRRNYEWFDLCGVSDARTPGVAEFKRGLNGEEYTLAGEYGVLF